MWTEGAMKLSPCNGCACQPLARQRLYCEPCTRPILPGQHEREGRWWWEDAKAKECGLHKGNIKEGQLNRNKFDHVIPEADLFKSSSIFNLTRDGIENLANLETRQESWLVRYTPLGANCAR